MICSKSRGWVGTIIVGDHYSSYAVLSFSELSDHAFDVGLVNSIM